MNYLHIKMKVSRLASEMKLLKTSYRSDKHTLILIYHLCLHYKLHISRNAYSPLYGLL